MNRIYIVKKSKGITSREVVNELNHILNYKKIGHTGTLDPIATGVLVCLTGKYTKLVDLITSYDKEYVAEIKLGIKTDTGDITGIVIESKNTILDIDKVKEVFVNFPKRYEQTVPKYSAVKINGKKLYQYARENVEIELPKRSVNIYELELLKYSNDLIKFRAKVSKGTYIRSLIDDICNNLGVIGTMNSLVRTKQGNFKIENASSLEEIKLGKAKFWSINEILDYPVIELNEENVKLVKNGNKIANKFDLQDKVIFTYNGKEIAIYENDDKFLKSYLQLI